MNKRAKYNFKFTDDEIKQIENTFNVSLSDVIVSKNSKKRRFDENIQLKLKNLGERINQIQEKNNLSDEQMSVLLNISNAEYFRIKNSKSIPDINTLNSLKQNFNISTDWLLYGE